LASHGNIAGIKDSSGDLRLLGMYLAAQSASFSVLTGNGGGLYSALEMGARGGVLAVSLFAAPLVMRVWTTFHHGDPGASGHTQERLVPLAKTIVARMGVAGVKAALDGVGLAGGPLRLPLLPLERDEREQVTTLLRGAGLLRAT
jgi:4-hydroxy-2-oxoglutarate aldolase